MHSRWNSGFEEFQEPRVWKEGHPRMLIWGLLEPILQELVNDPNYVKGLKLFQTKKLRRTNQNWAKQVLQEAISIFNKNCVLLWNLSTLFSQYEYENSCCFDCRHFYLTICAFYGIQLNKPILLGTIFVENPEDEDSVITNEILKFMRGDPPKWADDHCTKLLCKDAKEFWKNFRAVIEDVGKI
ncbi:hypothetical protein BZA77DRAFT_356887 [Pyronema omphalodes]|nr:hypothetical protein BZA77DRAFT_356887 [Pyronema omphalodes]